MNVCVQNIFFLKICMYIYLKKSSIFYEFKNKTLKTLFSFSSFFSINIFFAFAAIFIEFFMKFYPKKTSCK